MTRGGRRGDVWTVDPNVRAVDVWRYRAGATEPERVTGTLSWQPPGAAEALVIDLASVFAPI